MRLAAGHVFRLEDDFPGTRRHQSHQRLEERGLADAVAAEERRDLPRRNFEAHIPEDVAAAVILIELLNDQDRPRTPACRSAPGLSALRRLRCPGAARSP